MTEIDKGPTVICSCGVGLKLIHNLKRNIQTRGIGYKVKHERTYECPNCFKNRTIRSDGESWNPLDKP